MFDNGQVFFKGYHLKKKLNILIFKYIFKSKTHKMFLIKLKKVLKI